MGVGGNGSEEGGGLVGGKERERVGGKEKRVGENERGGWVGRRRSGREEEHGGVGVGCQWIQDFPKGGGGGG